jgi:hypothetical protein
VASNATDFGWTAVSDAAWLTVTAGAAGTGSGTVTYSVAANGTAVASRTGRLTIGGQTFTVTQGGVTGSVTLSLASDAVGAAGRVGGTVGVASNATDFGWTAVSDAAWLTVTAGAAGTGSGTVTYSVAANATSVAGRTGRLTIGGQIFTVTQGGVTGSVTLSPAAYAAPVAGVSGRSITVTANATDFAWTATSNASWLTVTGGAAGTGNGAVTYSVAANAGGERTGTLTIGGRPFAVTQGAKPEILVATTRFERTVVAGERTAPLVVALGGTPGLPVTVRVDVAWLEVTAGAGTLPGRLVMTPSAQLRPGLYVGLVTLLAEGAEPILVTVRYTVTEAPQFVALPTALELDGGTPQTLYVTSRGRQVRYAAEAVSDGGWLSVTAENGTTPVNLQVRANSFFLKPGVYTGMIRVTTPEAGGGGPIVVPVTVRVGAVGQ